MSIFLSEALKASAKTRLSRVIFDNTQTLDPQPDFWQTALTGSGEVSYEPSLGWTVLSTGGTLAGAQVVRESRQTFRYAPGVNHQAQLRFNLGNPLPGVRHRVGLFSAADGLFLEAQAGAVTLGYRTSITGSLQEMRWSQAQWNLDPLNGFGASRVNLSLSQPQTLVIELAWEGRGQCRFGFLIQGTVIWVHAFSPALTSPILWTSSDTLPLRYEITNLTGTPQPGTLGMIAQTVTADGGSEALWQPRGVDSGTVLKAPADTPGATCPVLSFQLKPGVTQATLIPRSLDLFNSSAGTGLWYLATETTLTGGTFTDTVSSRGLAIDTGATAVAGGQALLAGLLTMGEKTHVDLEALLSVEALFRARPGTSSVLTLFLKTLTSTAPEVYATFAWKELLG
jgi:hypothetical protein